MDLGPIAGWGARPRTAPRQGRSGHLPDHLPGVFAIGDVADLSRQAEADPAGLLRGRRGRARDPPHRASGRGAALRVFDDQGRAGAVRIAASDGQPTSLTGSRPRGHSGIVPDRNRRRHHERQGATAHVWPQHIGAPGFCHCHAAWGMCKLRAPGTRFTRGVFEGLRRLVQTGRGPLSPTSPEQASSRSRPSKRQAG